jgi:4-hydroxy 2-oxovalerate aldolase
MNVPSSQIRVLDCTLRDGGYYTQWEFDGDFVCEYLDLVARSPIHDVELGYRSPEKEAYFGRYFYLSKDDLSAARQRLREDQRLGLMFNLKDVDEDGIDALLGDVRGIVDLVRFAAAPGDIPRALALARRVIDGGFACAVNVMHLSKWSREVETVLAPFAQETRLDCLALVDSYGGCFPDDVGEAVARARSIFPGDLGFHGHDNAGLAFANSLSALQAGARSVDATFMGMGRGAGNLKTELMLTYVGIATGTEIPYFELSKFLDRMGELHAVYRWGTSLPYMYSSLSGQEQGKVMDWLIKDRFDPSVVMGALQDKLVAPGGSEAESFPRLRDYPALVGRRRFILVGGGASARRAAEALGRVDREDVAVLHTSLKSVEFFDNLEGHYIALSGHEIVKVSSDRLDALAATIAAWVIAPPPRFAGSVPGSGEVRQVNPAALFSVSEIAGVSVPSPLQIGLSAAVECGAEEVMLIGFDGYTDGRESSYAKNEENAETLAEYFSVANVPRLVSLAPSLYRVPVRSLHAMVQGR